MTLQLVTVTDLQLRDIKGKKIRYNQGIASYILNYFTKLSYLRKFLPTNLLSLRCSMWHSICYTQSPLLELMNGGMTKLDPSFLNPTADKNDCKLQKTSLHKFTPYEPKANHQTQPFKQTQFVRLHWLGCECH